MLSDIEIAESAKLKDIREVGKELGLSEDELELYGKYKAKISLPAGLERKGKLILVTAINPTASGEGKTTVSIGLADGLRRIGKKVCLAFSGTGVRHQRGRGGRRIRAGRAHGGHQSALHGGPARHHFGEQPALRSHGQPDFPGQSLKYRHG